MGHQDFAHELEGGIRLQFFWAPYPGNLTAVLGRLAAAQAGAAGGRRLRDDGQPPAEQQAAAQQAERPDQTAARQQGGMAAGSSPDALAEGQQQEQQQEGQEHETAGAEAAGELQWRAQQLGKRPALVTLSATLWHLLHMTSADGFEAELAPLGQAATAFAAAAAGSSAQGSSSGTASSTASGPQLVLASGTEMFPNRMKTAQKQHSMTPQNLDAYNRAMQQVGLCGSMSQVVTVLVESMALGIRTFICTNLHLTRTNLPRCPRVPAPSQAGLLAPSGPLALLDLFLLTQQCGEECSTDGVHSVPDVYDAALQLLLNLAAAARTGGGSSPIVGGQPGPARRRLRDRGHALPWRRVARP